MRTAIGLNGCSVMSENSFDAKKWQNSSREEPLRTGMLDDLYRKFNFKGQTSDEVVKVLGKPDLEDKKDTICS